MSENKENKEVTISSERYAELLKAEEELSALHAGGVDDWEWYNESLKDAGLRD